MPPGVQAGTINLTESCKVGVFNNLISIPVSATVSITGAAPTTAAPGQPIYLSDGQAQVTVPAYLIDLLRLVGATQISASAGTVNINLLGATQPSINIAAAGPIVIPPTKIVAGKPLVLNLPAGGGAFGNIGPITAASGQSIVDLGLGNVSMTAQTLNAQGKPTILPTATITCAAASPQVYLANVSIGGTPTSTPAIAPGSYAPATIPVGTVMGSTAATYACQFGSLGTYTVQLSTSAYASQLTGKVGQEYDFNNGQALVQAPASLVNAILASEGSAASQVTGAVTTLSNFDMSVQSGTPANLNVAAEQPIVSGDDPVSAGQPIAIHVPDSPNGLSRFGFTPSSAGEMYVYLQDSAGSVQPVDAGGNPVGSPVSFTCPTAYPLVPLLPLTVSN